jgi:hypothetical protein
MRTINTTIPVQAWDNILQVEMHNVTSLVPSTNQQCCSKHNTP